MPGSSLLTACRPVTTFGASPPRCRNFGHGREPLAHLPNAHIIHHKIDGPIKQLNPTRAHFHILDENDKAFYTQSTPEFTGKWRSRDNRKGRHLLKVHAATPKPGLPKKTNHPAEVLRGVVRMFTAFPVWDISYLVAVIFTLGSIVWVINAFFVFLPLIRPSSEFHNEILYGGGISAFVGATLFEVGSVLLLLEAVNENRTGCFGWAVERLLHQGTSNATAQVVQAEKHADSEKAIAGPSVHVRPVVPCDHHHSNRRNLVAPASDPANARKWRWLPSWKELRTHYFRELGFLASLIQFVAATIFWIAGFTSLPGIYDHMSSGLTDGVYWTPQIIGGFGFILSGAFFMIETQMTWWKPAPSVLGWHIGFWNLIGGVGFTLCPAFGYDRSSWAQYQASCSTFWGSWAFLIGSVIQWYESLDKHPVEYKDGEEGE
ncbi:hypothetical protein B0J12DRAFT_146649 [Macrophomina phaseolina]|uniref:Integral membrane protein n=1 Tax=Macrophomina phaseolina TaxID=35725 RepID=A0ABQ8G645_9PEZI|nr:hypothetical protein B0J12DRAFT_146649 [Macrophomina phaseolina]